MPKNKKQTTLIDNINISLLISSLDSLDPKPDIRAQGHKGAKT